MILVRVDYVDYAETTRRLERAKTRLFNANREAAQRMGEVYRNTARDVSPRDTGKFASRWKYRTQVRGDGASIDVVLYNDDPKASLIIEGTAPHIITPKRAKRLRFFGSSGDLVFTKMVFHPGTAPNDIYSKVMQQTEGEAARTFENSLRSFSDLI